VGTNLWLFEQKYMVVGTKTYGCGKNLWLWEQKQMFVGTKTYGCGNKKI
jgi:hypothetical protein